jgi:uncharacterized protein (TIGR00106 family)
MQMINLVHFLHSEVKNLAIIELTITPLGTGTPSVSAYVADVHKVLQQAPEPIKYELTAMSTILEGDLDDLLSVIRRMHEESFRHGIQRVSTSIRIDDRRDRAASIASKLDSVNRKLQD